MDRKKLYITSSLLKNDGQYLDSKIPYTSSYALNNGGVDLNRTTLLMGPSKTEIQKGKNKLTTHIGMYNVYAYLKLKLISSKKYK